MKRKQPSDDASASDSRLDPKSLQRMVDDNMINSGIEVCPGLYVSPLVLAALSNNDFAAAFLIRHGAQVFYRRVFTAATPFSHLGHAVDDTVFQLQPFALAYLDTIAHKLKKKTQPNIASFNRTSKSLDRLDFFI